MNFVNFIKDKTPFNVYNYYYNYNHYNHNGKIRKPKSS